MEASRRSLTTRGWTTILLSSSRRAGEAASIASGRLQHPRPVGVKGADAITVGKLGESGPCRVSRRLVVHVA
jgi:hypothetical protein